MKKLTLRRHSIRKLDQLTHVVGGNVKTGDTAKTYSDAPGCHIDTIGPPCWETAFCYTNGTC